MLQINRPMLSPAERAMCDAAGIATVEALASTDTAGAPNAIEDAAARARAFLATVRGADTERAERIAALEAETAALTEENAALRAEAKAALRAEAKAAKAARASTAKAKS